MTSIKVEKVCSKVLLSLSESLCWNAITQSEGKTGYWCIYVSGWKKTRRPNTSVYCSLLQSGALKTQNIRPRGTRMELCETNPGSSHSYGWNYQMHIEPGLPSVMDCIYFFPTGPLASSSLWICSRRISRSDPALTLRWWASTALASLDVKWWERVQRVWTAKSAALQVEFMYDKLAELVPRTRAKHITSKKRGKQNELQPRRQQGHRSCPKRSKVTANRGANSSSASVCHSHYITGSKSGLADSLNSTDGHAWSNKLSFEQVLL